MYSIYQDALVTPEPVIIAGYKIGQLTLVQSACLWAQENPFVVYARGDLAQFATALLVLQKSYPFDDVHKWVKQSFKMRKRLLKLNADQLGEQKDILIEYMKYHNKSHPRGFAPDKANKTPTVPWQWNVVFSLRRYFRESDVDAWNCPLLKAMAYHATICHNLGDDTLYNEMDCSIREDNLAKEELTKEEENN